MGAFDDLVADVAHRFNIDGQARSLVSNAVRFITEQSGGLSGFISRLKADGLGDLVAGWLGANDAPPMSEQQAQKVFGQSLIPSLATQLGLGSGVVTGALAFAVPKVVGLLTPNGAVPSGVPPMAAGFLHGAGAPPAAASAATASDSDQRKLIWPALVLLGLAGLVWYFLSTPQQGVAPSPVTQTAPALQPRLAISHDDATIGATGVVHDEATRKVILEALAAVFGADRIRDDLRIDPGAAAAPWLDRLRAALAKLNIPGLKAEFEGNAINIGGLIADADRDRLLAELKELFGTGFSFAALEDQVSFAIKDAALRARAALASLKPGFGGSDVVEVLNLTIINFASDSAQVPAFNRALLQETAAAMRQLPPETVIEIGGYTDSTGDPAANQSLSQRRAEAVREVLIESGVAPSALTAKGYGSDRPVASNETAEGRFQNRRIEYVLIR